MSLPSRVSLKLSHCGVEGQQLSSGVCARISQSAVPKQCKDTGITTYTFTSVGPSIDEGREGNKAEGCRNAHHCWKEEVRILLAGLNHNRKNMKVRSV